MKLLRVMGVTAVLLFGAVVAHAGALLVAPRVGDTYEITLVKDSVQQGTNGSSGSTHDNDTIIEQVTGVRADGLELLYDLPKNATADERARIWQFPVRVFMPSGGPAQLLDGPELEARLDGWLEAAHLARTACGQWIFTWNAFRIDCDPQSVLKTIQAYDLRSTDLRDGGFYRDSEAGSVGKLARKAAGPDGETFAVLMPVDADAVRRARAESDVVVGEIMKKPVSLEAALHERAGEIVSGTISITLKTGRDGNVRQRIKVTQLNIKGPDGRAETQTVTETLERRLISRRE
jgi:hypothetical protein